MLKWVQIGCRKAQWLNDYGTISYFRLQYKEVSVSCGLW